MYWDYCRDERLVVENEKKVKARKEHKCCECGKIIKIGEDYHYFFGIWEDYDCGRFVGEYKTCLECERDWDKILEVFRRNGEEDAFRVFTCLGNAIQDALGLGFLRKNNALVKRWIPIIDKKRIELEQRRLACPLQAIGIKP
jgi:hypothetical protein